MKIIQGISRQHIQFTSLEDLVAADNPVRILDAFVERLELSKTGIEPPNQCKQQSKANRGDAPRFDDKKNKSSGNGKDERS